MRERLSIIVDTREQRPYVFPNCNVYRKALDAGDYSLRGYQKWLRVERKSIGDWHSCLFRGATRLRSQLSRLSSFRYALVVVEAALSKRFSFSQLDPEGKSRITASLLADHGVPIVFCCTRSLARTVTENYLRYAKQRIDCEGIEEEQEAV